MSQVRTAQIELPEQVAGFRAAAAKVQSFFPAMPELPQAARSPIGSEFDALAARIQAAVHFGALA